MPHERPVDAAHPGCLVLLIDHSYSMLEPIAGAPETSKAQAVAGAVNRLLERLSSRAGPHASECHVSAIGYGQAVGPCFNGPLAGREMVTAAELASSGGGPWIDPTASGATPMAGALEQAVAVAASWASAHPESFPPVVVNISDGASTDGDPVGVAERLREISTSDGPALVFNATVTAIDPRVVAFATTPVTLPGDSPDVFEMSSVLPLRLHAAARGHGYAVEPGARGLVVNADAEALGALLDVAVSPIVAHEDPVSP